MCGACDGGFGFAGKPVIMRLHDKAHSWKDLGRLIPDMLAAGFAGCPFICPDMIGGGEWATLKLFKEAVALRQRFAPRFVSLARKSAKTGEQIMRNLSDRQIEVVLI